jgi:hypothetical protein
MQARQNDMFYFAAGLGHQCVLAFFALSSWSIEHKHHVIVGRYDTARIELDVVVFERNTDWVRHVIESSFLMRLPEGRKSNTV